MWKNNHEFTIFSGNIFGTTFHVYKEEIKDNSKIITTEVEKGFNTEIFTQTDNLKLVKNYEKIIKECKF